MATTLMKKSALLQPCTDGQATNVKKEKYQGMTGSIMFSMIEIRLDIIFAISVITQFDPGH